MGLYIFKSVPAVHQGRHTTHDNPWHRLNGSCGFPKGFSSYATPTLCLGW